MRLLRVYSKFQTKESIFGVYKKISDQTRVELTTQCSGYSYTFTNANKLQPFHKFINPKY